MASVRDRVSRAGWALLGRAGDDLTTADAGARRPSVWMILWGSVRTHPWGVAVSLLAGWTAFIPALMLAGIAGVGGVIFSFVAVMVHGMGPAVPSVLTSGISNSFGMLTIAGGGVVGALVGFGFAFGGSLVTAPEQALASLVTGSLVALIVTAIALKGQSLSLRIRGYRRCSFDEEQRLLPLLRGVARAMGIPVTTLPPIMMSDVDAAHAWAHPYALVVTRGLLEMLSSDEELAGVVAHELHHWRAGHPISRILVWACALPFVVLLNCVAFLVKAGNKNDVVAIVLLLLGWAVWAAAVVVVIPVQAMSVRAQEYEADAAAAAAGDAYREGLRTALLRLSALEGGRTGWEAAIAAQHPPTALRVERLASPDEVAMRTAERTRMAADLAAS